MNGFVDISNEALGVAYQAIAVVLYVLVVLLMTRLALTHKLFTKQIDDPRARTVVAAIVMLGASLATTGVTQMSVVGIIVLVANLFVIACLGAPEMVQKTWRVLDEIVYQMKRLCVMLGRAAVVWKATL